MKKKIQSVADVARLLDVHSEVALEYAERNELPKVGHQLVFSPRDVRDCERWINAASAAEADVPEDVDDENEDDDDEDEEVDEDADDAGEDGDEDDDDENEDDDEDEE